jgi:hypothetical protein
MWVKLVIMGRAQPASARPCSRIKFYSVCTLIAGMAPVFAAAVFAAAAATLALFTSAATPPSAATDPAPGAENAPDLHRSAWIPVYLRRSPQRTTAIHADLRCAYLRRSAQMFGVRAVGCTSSRHSWHHVLYCDQQQYHTRSLLYVGHGYRGIRDCCSPWEHWVCRHSEV